VGHEDERATSPTSRCCIERIDTPCCRTRRDRAQHTRAVGHFGEQVELRLDVVDRTDRLARERADGGALATLHEVLGRVDQVAEHRRRGRCAAGTASVEHELADRVTLDEHGVERVVHGGERMTLGHHGGVHAHRDLAVDLLGDREQLHHVPEVARRRDVVGRDPRDAFRDVGADHLCAERDRGDDRDLGSGVEALDVGGRVGLRESEGLRVGERVGERRALVGHLGEEVGGAFTKAGTADAVAGQLRMAG
jgi:hypothetical protein